MADVPGQECSRGGRAGPGHSLQLHPLCWITYNASCSLLHIQVCNLPHATEAGESRRLGFSLGSRRKQTGKKLIKIFKDRSF